MTNPHLREPGESLCVFLLGRHAQGSSVDSNGEPLLPSSFYLILRPCPRRVQSSLTAQAQRVEAHGKKPDSSSACGGQPRAGGDKQILREWRETYVFVLHMAEGL